ncbi:S9 family peptidase [Caulobacter sp. D5]|uniref:alpha/beta hydrolase family protein n=1 Tax=Caulobacter sp. D5 TaxID=357400 RepID=UPI0018EE5259|nr:acetylxylan esterase [Caulobacter sp. D5]
MRRRDLLAGAGVILASGGAVAAGVAVLTGEQAHRRMLDQLGIKGLRPGVDGLNPNAANPVNYDEARAGPFSLLPDPLALPDGTPVRDPKTWWTVRRPQIVETFAREIHGRVPRGLPAPVWRTVKTEHVTRGGVAVVERRLAGDVVAHGRTVTIDLLVGAPEGTAKVPCVVELGFPDGPPWLRGRPPPPPGGIAPDWRDAAIARGWAYGIYAPTSVQPDDPGKLQEGIIGLANRGRPRSPDDWGALRAWAWGVSRVVDLFEADPAIDAGRVAAAGMSRYGKAALLAMAYEPRLAAGYIASSGEGGAKLHRRRRGEQVENLAAVGEHHWMAGNFLRYAGPLTADDLPVDAHSLMALAAPRPLFIGAGADATDGWVDARGMFMAAAAASPVWRLLGGQGLDRQVFPPPLTLTQGDDLVFRQHAEGHTPGPNWPYFMDVAERAFRRAA